MEFEIVAEGLAFPEGPIACDDGSVLLVEVAAGRISRVKPDGRIQLVAETGGGPNGLAVGPDGALYCCNNGGHKWALSGARTPPPDDYTGGTIQRVNVSTGKAEIMLTDYQGRTLAGPNDIMFASDGSFWFTDFGKWTLDSTRHGGLYHANTTGSALRQITFAITLNGIGLSPDETTVYAAATRERWIMAYDTDPACDELQEGRMVASFPGRQLLDSLAMEADGTIAVGCLYENPGIGRVNPAAGSIDLVPTPDSMPTNICFGGPDMRTTYITASKRGALLKCRWPTPGLRLPFNL
jgi:gluconolactonase